MSQPSLRGRVVLKFPANVVAGYGIIIDKTNSTYTFSVDPSILEGLGGGEGGGIPEAPNDGQQYGRQSLAWTVIVPGGGGTGITNPLIIPGGGVVPIAIISTIGGLNRWRLNLGDSEPETGIAGGSDFHLDSYNNDGTYRNLVIHADRDTSEVTITGGPPPHNAILGLNKLADGQACTLQGLRSGSLRWGLALGDSGSETAGGNTGSDFRINRYDDAGDFLAAPLLIERRTGSTWLTGGLVPDRPTLAINKIGSGQASSIEGWTAGIRRWGLTLGDVGAEGGTQTGSDFRINRFTNTGTLINVPLHIRRDNGTVILTGTHPSPPSGPEPTLALNKTAGGMPVAIQGQTAFSPRWDIVMGDSVAETGTATGSDFRIHRYNNAGAFLDVPLWIKRSTGETVLTVSPPDQKGMLILNKTSGNAPGQSSAIQGANLTSTRWHLALGDGAAEGGSNSGSDFRIHAHNDDGSFRTATTLIVRADSTLLHVGEAQKTTGALWTAVSDARVKTITGDYTKGLTAIKALTPKRFTYNGTDVKYSGADQPQTSSVTRGKPNPASPHYQLAIDGTEMIGLIAQEAEVPMPELVKQTTATLDGVQVDDYRTLNAEAVIWALVNAVKELSARVEALEGAP